MPPTVKFSVHDIVALVGKAHEKTHTRVGQLPIFSAKAKLELRNLTRHKIYVFVGLGLNKLILSLSKHFSCNNRAIFINEKLIRTEASGDDMPCVCAINS